MLSEQQQRILGYFIEEAKDHLNTIEQGLLNLQGTIEDPEMVSEVFRAAHSVKGGAAMLGLNSIQQTAHRLEDYFKVLKECPIQVDQKLENFFFTIFDGLKELLEQLQGPFGLTDDKAEEVMAGIEPTFRELGEHLSLLVSQSGGVPPEEVQLHPVATPPTPTVVARRPDAEESSALQLIFQSDVPTRLRDMLQLFKQAETLETRQQLETLCRSLASAGEQFDLSPWCELCETARKAIACPDNDYRTLAPVVIKAIKQAQDLVLNGRTSEIVISEGLHGLVPVTAAEESEAAMDFDALLAAMDTDEGDDEAAVELIDFGLVADTSFEEDLAIATEDAGDFDGGFDFLSITDEESVSDLSEEPLGLDELQLETLDELNTETSWNTPPDGLGLDMSGPEVGAAELNSLADLFEGEMPDLGLTWQEEEVIGSTPSSNHSSPFESEGDFDDLLFDQDDNLDELDLEDDGSTDLSALLSNGDASAVRLDSSPSDLPFAAEDSESLADLLNTVDEEPEEPSGDADLLFADLDDSPNLDTASERVASNLDLSTSPWDEPGGSNESLDAGLDLDMFGFGPDDSSLEMGDSFAEAMDAPMVPDGATGEELTDSTSFDNLFADASLDSAMTQADEAMELGWANEASGAEESLAPESASPSTEEMAANFPLDNFLEGDEVASDLELGFADSSDATDIADLFGDDPVSQEEGESVESWMPDSTEAPLESLLGDAADESFLDPGTDAGPFLEDSFSTPATADAESIGDELDDGFFESLGGLDVTEEAVEPLFDGLALSESDSPVEALFGGMDAAPGEDADDSPWAGLDFEGIPGDEFPSAAESLMESSFEPFELGEETSELLVSDGSTDADSLFDQGWDDVSGASLQEGPIEALETDEVLSDGTLLDALEFASVEDSDGNASDTGLFESMALENESLWSESVAEGDEAIASDESLLDLLGSEVQGERVEPDPSSSGLTLDEPSTDAFFSDPELPSDLWTELSADETEPGSDLWADLPGDETGAGSDDLWADLPGDETGAGSDLSAFSDLVGGLEAAPDAPLGLDAESDAEPGLAFFDDLENQGDGRLDGLMDSMLDAASDSLPDPALELSSVSDPMAVEEMAGAEEDMAAVFTEPDASFDIDALFDQEPVGEESADLDAEAIAGLFDSSADGGMDLGLLSVMDEADASLADPDLGEEEALAASFGDLAADVDLEFESPAASTEATAEAIAEAQDNWMDFSGLEVSNPSDSEFDSSLDGLDLGELTFSDMGMDSADTEVEPDLSAMLEAATRGSEDSDAPFDFDALLDDTELPSTEPERSPSLSNDDFADLESLLSGPDDVSPAPAVTSAEAEDDDFANLEALLDDVSVPAAAVEPIAPAVDMSEPSEFDDLERLLEDADQTLGGPPSSRSTRRPPMAGNRRQPRRGAGTLADQTMRVSVKNLDNLNNLVGELVVNRNSLEQAEERLRQFLDNLLYQVQQLSDVGQRMRDLYERSLLESSLLSSRKTYQMANPTGAAAAAQSHATGMSFDALEMDRFTGFHTLSQEMIELIVRVRESASDIDFVVDETDQITRNFRQITTQLQEGLTRSRMVPFGQTADRLPRAVRDISLKCGKQAELVVEGRDTLIDKMILEQLYDPMTHLVNNAITHGIETAEERLASGKPATGRITVRTFHQGNQTVIAVTDDGAGIDPEMVKRKAVEKRLITARQASEMSRLDVYDLLFHHGFSTRDKADDFAGRGVGMDVVRTSLNEIRGVINIDSTIGQGTTFTIRLPLTLSISKALCCISNRARIAFPMDGVEDMLDVPKERILRDDQGRPCIQWRDTLLPFTSLSELLKYNRSLGRGSVYGGNQEDDIVSVVVLRSAGNYLALQVDQVLGEQEIVIKQLEGPVPKPVGVAGATVLGDGRIMPIADVLELIDLSMGRIRRDSTGSLWEKDDVRLPVEPAEVKTEPTVLIVDDSITVRELLSMTFNKVGYRVEQARDGQEAWEKLRSGLPCDLVFCDIEMPRMDGLELLSRIQKDASLSHLPIAMLTSRGADRHRQMAIQLGAKGYFTKPYLEEALLDAAQRMLKGEWLIGGS